MTSDLPASPGPFQFSPEPPAPPTETAGTRSRASVVAIALLGVALVGAIAVGTWVYFQLREANARIEEQNRELEEQRDLINKKDVFGAAMAKLVSSTQQFDGVLMSNLIDTDSYESFALRAWTHRWDSEALDRDTEHVTSAIRHLDELLATASAQAASNSTGSMYESIIDNLGRGFVASTIEDADAFCEADVLACVASEDPYTVHFDAADNAVPYMTDWIRTGVAYHEFAHVLQFTNPVPTATALKAFGDDPETMADCFALTYLDGWTLDHQVWVSSYEYYDVSVGYGYSCDDAQKQAVRDWYSQLPFTSRPISQ